MAKFEFYKKTYESTMPTTFLDMDRLKENLNAYVDFKTTLDAQKEVTEESKSRLNMLRLAVIVRCFSSIKFINNALSRIDITNSRDPMDKRTVEKYVRDIDTIVEVFGTIEGEIAFLDIID